MNIVFCLFKYFPFGGLQRDFMEMALHCQEQGHHVTIFTMEWSGPIPQGFQVELVPTKGFTNHKRCYYFANRVLPLLNHRNFSIVIGFNKMPGLDVYYAADPCYRERTHRKYHAHYGPLYRMTPRYRHMAWLEQAVFEPSSKTKILLLAPSEQDKFVHHYQTPRDRFYHLPPGISKDRILPEDLGAVRRAFRQEFNIPENNFLLLMVGTHLKGKGLDRTLRAFRSLPSHLHRRTKVIAVGESRIGSIRRLTRGMHLNGQIKILPARVDISRFMVGADLLLHPAYSDNTGTVILESIIAGLPVLATDSCGYAHHIIKADAGLVLTSPFHQPDLNQALYQSLDSPIRHRWSQNGLAYGKIHDLFQRTCSAVKIIETSAQGNFFAHSPI